MRTKYHFNHVALAGDVLAPQPPGYWSRLQLAVDKLQAQDRQPLFRDLEPFDVDLLERDRPHIARQIARGDPMVEDL